MEPLGWLRVRIDPSVPQWWRTNGNFVVGHVDDQASSAVEVSNNATQFSTLTQLLDGSHSAHGLLQSGQAMGLSAADVRSFLISLAAAGHIHEVEVVATPLIAHAAIRNVRHLARARGNVESSAGKAIVLSGVAAAVVGGVSLFGGRGRLSHAAIGAIVISMIDNGLGLLQMPAGANFLITGGVLLLAATLDALARRRSGGSIARN